MYQYISSAPIIILDDAEAKVAFHVEEAPVLDEVEEAKVAFRVEEAPVLDVEEEVEEDDVEAEVEEDDVEAEVEVEVEVAAIGNKTVAWPLSGADSPFAVFVLQLPIVPLLVVVVQSQPTTHKLMGWSRRRSQRRCSSQR